MRETLAPWRNPPLTQEQEDDLFMLRAETPEGRILPTLEEAEEEVERLRRDIARLRREST